MFSISGILSKFASKQTFLSANFILIYVGVLFLLVIYAIGWQQILKKMDLTSAFVNKGVLLIWGMVWGSLFFHEIITIQMLLGCVIIILGIYWVVKNE